MPLLKTCMSAAYWAACASVICKAAVTVTGAGDRALDVTVAEGVAVTPAWECRAFLTRFEPSTLATTTATITSTTAITIRGRRFTIWCHASKITGRVVSPCIFIPQCDKGMSSYKDMLTRKAPATKKRTEPIAIKISPQNPPKPERPDVQPLKAVTWGDMVAEEEELDEGSSG